MNSIKLQGHSGCLVELINRRDTLIVRKTSKSIDYNIRLKKQSLKQERFSHSFLRSPRVLAKDYINNLFYFEMEYIQGTSFANYVATMKISDLEYYADELLNYVKGIQGQEEIQTESVFREKINHLKIKFNLNQDELVVKAVSILEGFSWAAVSKSQCHGDLTFENIIIKQGQLYLIDFLDSFYNSWMLDLAKIFQDLEVFWSYRNYQHSENVKIRLLIFKRIILTKLLKMNNGFDIITTIYHILLLNILRILPYVDNEKTYNYLILALNKVIMKIELIEEDLDKFILKEVL